MLSNKYILVGKPEEKEEEGFKTVKVEDSSIYTGVVRALPEIPVYMGNKQIVVGDTVIFAKYSPNTHRIERNGEELKYIAIEDLLEVIDNK